MPLPNPGYLDTCLTCNGTKPDPERTCPKCNGRGKVNFCQRCKKVQQFHSCGGLAPGWDTHCIRTGPEDTRTGQEIFDTDPEFAFLRGVIRKNREKKEAREAREKKNA